jgi:glycosyltransferase involved in cell wall biosynthesis
LCNVWTFMKIAVDLTPMRPGGENGGVKLAIIEFLKGLKTHLSGQVQYLFLTSDDTHDEVVSILGANDAAFCVFRRSGRGNLVQTLDLATRSKLLAYSLIQQHHADALYHPFGTVFFALDGIPAVAMIVDTLHRDFPYSLPAQTVEWRELQFRKLVDSVDYFQVISEYTAERVKSLYNIPADRIFVTRLPIHGRLTSRSALRQPFFFYPANFWVHKNHEVLLVAYQIYLAKTPKKPPWKLVFTGHSDERARSLQKIAADLAISEHVKFSGHVPESELAKLYSTASCLVFPSLHEGFGIPILEAMSFGLPVICGKDTSVPEIAGDAAFYAETRDPVKLAGALLTVAENDALRGELANVGRERLKTFNYIAEIERLANVFAAAAAQKSRTPRRKRRFLQRVLPSVSYCARALARKALNAAVEIPMACIDHKF